VAGQQAINVTTAIRLDEFFHSAALLKKKIGSAMGQSDMRPKIALQIQLAIPQFFPAGLTAGCLLLQMSPPSSRFLHCGAKKKAALSRQLSSPRADH